MKISCHRNVPKRVLMVDDTLRSIESTQDWFIIDSELDRRLMSIRHDKECEQDFINAWGVNNYGRRIIIVLRKLKVIRACVDYFSLPLHILRWDSISILHSFKSRHLEWTFSLIKTWFSYATTSSQASMPYPFTYTVESTQWFIDKLLVAGDLFQSLFACTINLDFFEDLFKILVYFLIISFKIHQSTNIFYIRFLGNLIIQSFKLQLKFSQIISKIIWVA